MRFDWVAALDALGAGHTMVAVERVRGIVAAMGGTPPPPLHALERAEVDRLRRVARASLSKADEIEARAGGGDDSRLTRCAACGAPSELCGHAA